MRRFKVAVLGWEPPSRSRVATGAGMYLGYLTELGAFARGQGLKLDLTFIVPSQKDRLARHNHYRVLFVKTRGFCERRPYDADVLYPAARQFAERLVGRRSPVDIKKFDVVLASSFAFGELIARAKLDNLVYISHRPEFLREKLAGRFGVKLATRSRLGRDARMEAKAVENSVRTVTVSKACKRELARKFDRTRIDVIYNGVDTGLFHRVGGEPNGKVVLTYAGRNHPEKGLQLLLRGVRHVVDQGCSDFEIRLLTNDGISLRRAVERMDISEQVKMLGWHRLRDLPKYYSGSTFTIMPSYWESFSYATAEGLACEVPALVSTAGALPEIVNEGVGMRFRVGDEFDLARKLEDACHCDPGDVVLMGKRGRRYIQYRFSKETFLKNYLDYIEHFVDGNLF